MGDLGVMFYGPNMDIIGWIKNRYFDNYSYSMAESKEKSYHALMDCLLCEYYTESLHSAKEPYVKPVRLVSFFFILSMNAL